MMNSRHVRARRLNFEPPCRVTKKLFGARVRRAFMRLHDNVRGARNAMYPQSEAMASIRRPRRNRRT